MDIINALEHGILTIFGQTHDIATADFIFRDGRMSRRDISDKFTHEKKIEHLISTLHIPLNNSGIIELMNRTGALRVAAYTGRTQFDLDIPPSGISSAQLAVLRELSKMDNSVMLFYVLLNERGWRQHFGRIDAVTPVALARLAQAVNQRSF